MSSPDTPYIQDRGREAARILSEPGPSTAAEVLALAVLLGELQAPVVNDEEGA
jgi:hypothetical protein